MKIPLTRQPSWEEVARQLDASERWAAAWARKEHPLPSYPAGLPPPSNIKLWWGAISRLGLFGVGTVGALARSVRLRLWSADGRVRIDQFWYEPASCSLNTAFTDLGLALLEMGDIPGAVECLRRSQYVYPCPHNTTFGLSDRLWRALARFPDAVEARSEYEEVARRFSSSFGLPCRKRTLTQEIRILAKGMREGLR